MATDHDNLIRSEAEVQQWINEIDQQVEDGLFTKEEGETKKQALRRKIPA